MKKFYNIKNKLGNVVDIYVYGVIKSGSWKWDETDVVAQDFIKAFEGLVKGDVVNVYINSPGGSVFITSGILGIITRARENGVYVKMHIDGLAASCASFLAMCCDELICYDTSTVMIHRAQVEARGSASDLKEMAELLEQLEDSVIIPMYMSRAKEHVNEEQLKTMMAVETWMDSKKFTELFDVTLVENTKKISAYADLELVKDYQNVPDFIKAMYSDKIEDSAKMIDSEEPEVVTQNEIELAKAKLILALATL